MEFAKYLLQKSNLATVSEIFATYFCLYLLGFFNGSFGLEIVIFLAKYTSAYINKLIRHISPSGSDQVSVYLNLLISDESQKS